MKRNENDLIMANWQTIEAKFKLLENYYCRNDRMDLAIEAQNLRKQINEKKEEFSKKYHKGEKGESSIIHKIEDVA